MESWFAFFSLPFFHFADDDVKQQQHQQALLPIVLSTPALFTLAALTRSPHSPATHKRRRKQRQRRRQRRQQRQSKGKRGMHTLSFSRRRALSPRFSVAHSLSCTCTHTHSRCIVRECVCVHACVCVAGDQSIDLEMRTEQGMRESGAADFPASLSPHPLLTSLHPLFPHSFVTCCLL